MKIKNIRSTSDVIGCKADEIMDTTTIDKCVTMPQYTILHALVTELVKINCPRVQIKRIINTIVYAIIDAEAKAESDRKAGEE